MDDNSKPAGDVYAANPCDSDRSVEIVVVDVEDGGAETDSNPASLSRPSSSPVTDLNQVEGDHDPASSLQEQEEADMTVRMTNDGSDNGNSEDGSHNHDDEFDNDDYHDLDDDQYEDEFEDDDSEDLMDDDNNEDVDGEDLMDDNDDGGEDLIDDDEGEEDKDEDKDEDEGERMSSYDSNGFPDDHTIMRDLENWNGRWLMDDMDLSAEALEMDYYDHYYGDHSQPQDTLEEGYSDEIYYEDYWFGDLHGTEIAGVSPELLQFLPTDIYSLDKGLDGKPNPCVICQSDYKDGESITPLPCKHSYHSKCITTWLKIKGVCPICNAEVLGSDAWHIANELSLL